MIKGGETVFHMLVRGGNTELVKHLLQRGYPVDPPRFIKPSNNNYIFYSYNNAFWAERPEDNDPEAADPLSLTLSPLFIAVLHNHKGFIIYSSFIIILSLLTLFSEIIQELIGRGALITTEFVHWAVHNCDLSIIELMLKDGDDDEKINVVNNRAVMLGNVELMEFMIKKGWNKTRDPENQLSPLHYAALLGKVNHSSPFLSSFPLSFSSTF